MKQIDIKEINKLTKEDFKEDVLITNVNTIGNMSYVKDFFKTLDIKSFIFISGFITNSILFIKEQDTAFASKLYTDTSLTYISKDENLVGYKLKG